MGDQSKGRAHVALSSAVAAALLAVIAPANAQTGYSWTGFHIGLNVGGGFGNTDAHSQNFAIPNGAPSFTPPFSPETVHFSTAGFIGGAQAGYDMQIGSLVIGTEGDLSGSTIGGDHVTRDISQGGVMAPLTYIQKSEIEWLATLRVRAGVEVIPRILPYITGGLAFAGVRGTQNLSFAPPGFSVYQSSNSAVRTGGVIGAGVAYGLLPNVQLRLEYLRVALDKFGTQAIQSRPAILGPPGFTQNTTYSSQINIVRIGADLHF